MLEGARHGYRTVRHDMARHVTLHVMARFGTARHGTARHAITRHDTTPHDPVRHGTAHGTLRQGKTWHVMAPHDMARQMSKVRFHNGFRDKDISFPNPR